MGRLELSRGHRRSARISALEEAHVLALHKQTKSQTCSSPPPAAKKRGRKRKSLQAVVVNSVTVSPHQEGEDTKHEDTATRAEQLENLPSLQRMPKKQTLEFVLDILQRRDTREIFAQPVDAEDVVDYYDIIKEPMDFGTMRAKLQEGMYTSLEQLERDVFLISSNAMKFNSSTTVYYTEARAISELAQRLFCFLRTEPENFQLECSRTRRRPGRKPQSEAGDLHSGTSKPGGSRASVSLNYPSVMKATQHSFVSSHLKPYMGQMSNKIPSLSRHGRNLLNSLETERRMTYMSQSSFGSENDKIVSAVYSAPKPLTHVRISFREARYRVASSGTRYGDSLMNFVKDLGPTAQIVAGKKLGKSPIEAPKFLSWTSSPFGKTAGALLPTPPSLRSPNGQMSYNFLSNPSASYKGKMVCVDGAKNNFGGQEIPTPQTSNGGNINSNLLQEEGTVKTSRNADAAGGSSKTSDNVDLLIATLMQISTIQNKNNHTPSGYYYPLTGHEDVPALPSSHINNESPSWLLKNHSGPYHTTKVSSTSKTVSNTSTSSYPNGEGSSTAAPAALDQNKLVQWKQPVQPVMQTPWGLPSICELPVLQEHAIDHQQINPSSQNMFFQQQLQSLVPTQDLPSFNATNFLEGANPQAYHHQAQSSARYFWNSQQSFLGDDKQPDLNLQL